MDKAKQNEKHSLRAKTDEEQKKKTRGKREQESKSHLCVISFNQTENNTITPIFEFAGYLFSVLNCFQFVTFFVRTRAGVVFCFGALRTSRARCRCLCPDDAKQKIATLHSMVQRLLPPPNRSQKDEKQTQKEQQNVFESL